MEDDVSEIYLGHSFQDSSSHNSLEGIVPEIQIGTFECPSDLTIVPFETCPSLGYSTAYLPNEFTGETCEFLWADENCAPLLAIPPDFWLEDSNPDNFGNCGFAVANSCSNVGSSLFVQASVAVTSTEVHDGMDVTDYGVWDIIHHMGDGVLANEFLANTQNIQADEIRSISCLEMFPSDRTLDALDTISEDPDKENGDINNLQLACTTNFQDDRARSESCQYPSIVESDQNITLEDSIGIEADNSHHADGSLLSTLQLRSEKEMITSDFFEDSSPRECPLPTYSCDKKSESQLIHHRCQEDTSHLLKYKQTAESNEMECMSQWSIPRRSRKSDDTEPDKLVLYSDGQKKGFQRDASKELWIPMSEGSVPGGEYFPDAVKYCALLSTKRKSDRIEMRKSMELNQVEMIMKAKLHLLFLGWNVEFKKDKDNRTDRYRYNSPGGTRFYSLSKACKAAIEQGRAQSFKQKGTCVIANSDFPQDTQSLPGQTSAAEGHPEPRRILKVKLKKQCTPSSSGCGISSKKNPMHTEACETSQKMLDPAGRPETNAQHVHFPKVSGRKTASSHTSSSSMSLTSIDHTVVNIKPKYCPRAIMSYLEYELGKKYPVSNSSSSVNNKDEQLGSNAGMHLLAVGWKLLGGLKQGESHMRYISPSGKCFNSLRTACEAWRKYHGMA